MSILKENKHLRMLIFSYLLWTSLFGFVDFICQASENAGRAVTVIGKVLVFQNENDRSPRELETGDTIHVGEIIKTGNDGTIKILLNDKSVIDLGHSASMQINGLKLNEMENREVNINLNYGKVRSLVNRKLNDRGRFVIRTRSAVLGVRGTEFIIDSPVGKGGAPTGDYQLTVIKGKVDLSDLKSNANSPPLSIAEGMQVSSVHTQMEPPKATQLAPDRLQSALQSAKVQDVTFREGLLSPGSSKSKSEQGAVGIAIASMKVAPPENFRPKSADAGGPGVFGAGRDIGGMPTQIPRLIQGAGPNINLTVNFN